MFQLNVSFCYSQDLFYMIYHPRITPRTDSKQVYVFLRVTTSEVWNRFKTFLISTEQFNMDRSVHHPCPGGLASPRVPGSRPTVL